MSPNYAPAEWLCRFLDWDWSDETQRQTCIDAATELVNVEREACASIADMNRTAFEITSPVGEAMSLMAGNIARQIRSRAYVTTRKDAGHGPDL